jgi:hypothetical protein
LGLINGVLGTAVGGRCRGAEHLAAARRFDDDRGADGDHRSRRDGNRRHEHDAAPTIRRPAAPQTARRDHRQQHVQPVPSQDGSTVVHPGPINQALILPPVEGPTEVDTGERSR